MSNLHGIRKTQVFTQYLRKLLAAEIRGDDVEMPECALDFLEEMHFIVKLVKQAIKNKSM
jgi:hypothetical protein